MQAFVLTLSRFGWAAAGGRRGGRSWALSQRCGCQSRTLALCFFQEGRLKRC